MPIQVRHDPSAEVIGKSAYQIGVGQGAERRLQMDREYELRQRQQALQALSIAAHHQAQSQRLELHRQMYEEAPGRELQRALLASGGGGGFGSSGGSGGYGYTDKQVREMNKIQDGISWLRGEVVKGNWTPEQAEKAEQQLWREYYGILPQLQYNNKPTPQEYANQQIITLPNGAKGWVDSKGNIKPLPGEITPEIFNKFYDSAQNALELSVGENETVSPEAIEAEIRKRITLYRKTTASVAAAQAEAAEQEKQNRLNQMGMLGPDMISGLTMESGVMNEPQRTTTHIPEEQKKIPPISQFEDIWSNLSKQQQDLIWQAWEQAQTKGVTPEEFFTKWKQMSGK